MKKPNNGWSWLWWWMAFAVSFALLVFLMTYSPGGKHTLDPNQWRDDVQFVIF